MPTVHWSGGGEVLIEEITFAKARNYLIQMSDEVWRLRFLKIVVDMI
ncbi:MAG: hypothetical protein GX230_03780 [Lentisphaerae bacterium]|jgi:hypothetical protein|nr:hypothetical protein [Lentisphaerota bacterium]